MGALFEPHHDMTLTISTEVSNATIQTTQQPARSSPANQPYLVVTFIEPLARMNRELAVLLAERDKVADQIAALVAGTGNAAKVIQPYMLCVKVTRAAFAKVGALLAQAKDAAKDAVVDGQPAEPAEGEGSGEYAARISGMLYGPFGRTMSSVLIVPYQLARRLIFAGRFPTPP